MRLLETSGDGQIKFAPSLPTPPLYGILSHTWGDDEVTYQDLLSGRGRDKQGYRKIAFCAEQARKDGLCYFWVDTCCIDKSDQAGDELSRALRSMYRWYRNAYRCYVYLEDVEWDVHEQTRLLSFQKSGWFARGWTLQELLAPPTVQFFTRDGRLLGDKTSLEKQLSETSGIPPQALHGSDLEGFSVSERMTWAAKRETKEPEDAAYCLFGIFNVSMPVLYGEGKEMAMARLRAVIDEFGVLKQINGREVPFIVPFERNTNFTGRQEQLGRIQGRLVTAQRTTRLAISGLGGVGKTQLALELAFWMRKRDPDCAVIWIQMTSIDSYEQGYGNVAQQLKLAGSEEQQVDHKQLVCEHLSREAAGRWLLIYDNADDIDMWTQKQGSGKSLSEYLPQSKHGSILFTTRSKKVAARLAKQDVIELEEMDEDAARLLLQRRLIQPDLILDEPATTALIKQLTYLPLAIVQAAAYINENGISIEDYRSLLDEQEEEVVELLSEDFDEDGRYHDMQNPVATTWLVSFARLRQCHSLAADYLSFLACVSPKDVPQSLLPEGASRKQEMDAVGQLLAYAFVTRQSASSTLDMHRLVHLATRSWLRKEGVLEQWYTKTVDRLAVVFPTNDHENRALWRSYVPHASYVLKMGQGEVMTSARIMLAWNLGLCELSDVHYEAAHDAITEVLRHKEKTLGREHPDALTTMASLALIYEKQGRLKEAEELEVVVVETMKRVHGAEHLATLTIIGSLASAYRGQGRWKEAEELEVEVMETKKRVLGVEHLDTLITMGNLASTYRAQGRWKEAEELQVVVTETTKRVLGTEHPDTLLRMSNLAFTYYEQGRWQEAEELEVVVIETRKRVLGTEHPDTLTSINNLAVTYSRQGRWQEAEELELEATETRKRVLGIEHPDTLVSIDNLASIYWGQGRWKEAEDLEVVAVETRKRIFGAEHPDTLTSMHNLAVTYQSVGCSADATSLMSNCYELRVKVIGLNHPDTLSSKSFLDSWRDEESKV